MIYKIDENLFQGSCPENPEDLFCEETRKRKIDAIINLMSYEEDQYFPWVPQVDAYIRFPIYDGPSPGLAWLKTAVGVAESLRAKYPLLVHCQMGISRSTTLTAAILMSEKRWARDKALEMIAKINPKIDPNTYFLKLLKEYEQDLKGM